MLELLRLFIYSVWSVLGQMAPYLIFGYLVAGILSVFVTPDTVKSHLGGDKFLSTLKAAVFGMPLPLCSCGVIPVTASLYKRGAGRGAVASFLISTPTTGIDSIMAAWALMGPVFAIYRAIMSVLLGISTGVFVNIFGDENIRVAEHAADCDVYYGGSCTCEVENRPKGNILSRALRYAFITIPKDLGKPLFIGILIAAAISTLIDAKIIDQFLGGGIGTMIIMLLVGVPLYVCSTASIPLALGFMALGASPGAAFVFLIAGPATNAATITVLWKMIGKRSTLIMLGCMFAGALGGGLLLDAVWSDLGVSIAANELHDMSHLGWFESVSAVVFVLIQFWAEFRGRIITRFTGRQVADACCGHDHEHAHGTGGADCCAEKAHAHAGCCGHEKVQETGDSCCSGKKEGAVGVMEAVSSCCSEHTESVPGSCCAHGVKKIVEPGCSEVTEKKGCDSSAPGVVASGKRKTDSTDGISCCGH